MNITNNNDSEFYEHLTMEIGILQEAIKLDDPSSSKETDPLTLSTLIRYNDEGRIYDVTLSQYRNMVGKFYIPVLFPLVDKSDGPEEYEYKAPRANLSNGTIKPVKYISTNYVELVIPRYIVMQFDKEIPKDTKFLIGFSGEHKKISNLNVVGIYGADLTI